jgi:probable phosphomutase (TIGR03848 family)
VTTVVLIRHGRTSANATGILAGRTPGVLLDAVGRRQARTLGTRLRDVTLDAVVHSPLERCVQTADGVLANRPDVARRADDRLSECDYGDWTGRSLADLAKDPLWPVIQDTPSSVTFPGGESMLGMAHRATTAIAEWSAKHPEGVLAVVSHGDVIKAILSDALGQPLDKFQGIVVGPGSLSVVRYHGDRAMVLRMNDTGRTLPIQPGTGQPTVGGGTG